MAFSRAFVTCLGAAAFLIGCDWAVYQPPDNALTGGGGPGSGGAGGGGMGGGGQGGAGPEVCGTVDMLSEDFEEPYPPQLWAPGSGYTGVVSQGAGALTLSVANHADAYANLRPRRYHDFRGATAAVQVTSALTSLGPYAQFALYRDDGNYLAFRKDEGMLKIQRRVGYGHVDLMTPLTYDAAAHLWWRFRHDADAKKLVWETSADGADWTAVHEQPENALISLEHIKLQLDANGDQDPSATAELFTISDVVIDADGSGTWCPASYLQDDFDDGVRSDNWLHSGGSPGGGSAFEFGGEVAINLVPNAVNGAYGYSSSRGYDLTNNAVTVELLEAGAGTASFLVLDRTTDIGENHKVNLQVREVDEGNGPVWKIEAVTNLNGQVTVEGTKDYDPAIHRFLRLSHDGDALRWDASPDGKTWPSSGSDPGFIAASSPPPIELTDLAVAFGASTPLATAAPGQCRFDNFNTVP